MQPRLVTLIFHSFTYPRKKKTTLHSLLTKQYPFECKTMYLLREKYLLLIRLKCISCYVEIKACSNCSYCLKTKLNILVISYQFPTG